MGVYRVVWLGVVGTLLVIGTGIAVVSVSPGALISLALCAAIVGPLIGAGVHAQTRAPTMPLPHYLMAVTVLAAVGVIAITGLIALVGAVALLCVALLATSSPPVLRRLLHHERRAVPKVAAAGEPPAPTVLPAPMPPPSYASLTDVELCWRWRTSFAALQHTASPGERLRLIEIRSALLDELATRNPEGFTRWMSSGARAASDPARFLTPHHLDQPRRHDEH